MFTLIDLPYAPDALEPVISAQTLSFHHGKHLQAYVDNLNKLIPGTEFESMSLEEIVARSASLPAPTGNPIFNNAGQILNHNLYFTQFRPRHSRLDLSRHSRLDLSRHSRLDRESAPTGPLKAQIESQWGTLEAFQKEFVAKGVGLFGSGWVWLQADAAGTLSIGQYPGADNPVAHVMPGSTSSVMPGSTSSVMPGSTGHLTPILTFDVWEHAYYLDYQNRRAAHLEALWGIVDWGVVEERYGH